MPTVEPSPNVKVLVTGANGFIAMWVIKSLLDQGYAVRGVVRSVAKGARLKECFKAHGDKLELFIVEDMMKDGAFDEAVKDVDAIEHTASPLPEANLIQPAVLGTLGILKSATKYGTNVKRIVITSSVGAIIGYADSPTVIFDETNWADEFVNEVKTLGTAASKMSKYRASKTLAEKAAWNFYEENKQKIEWDLVVLNPTVVLGPSLQDEKSPENLSSSLAAFYDNIFNEKPDDALKLCFGYIDVRDIAEAHVKSLRIVGAGGERMIISEGGLTWQETRNRLQKLFPKLYEDGILPRGNADLDKSLLYAYNNEKGRRILGFQYRDLDSILRGTIKSFAQKGWVKLPAA
ncbi:hypothetical protein D9619_003755 [Psilocybe cf. subviscida]|uniref:NAD-dependent epimerase/dehydratase domain-containing protein n=1 Tax=Psilocybe cf. subviscida TaxID=2480587 RepID=A0A8H5AY32_9AGAR|nr:hypothetical protein D9619_003755 [Psilocybe cf. subviscida]